MVKLKKDLKTQLKKILIKNRPVFSAEKGSFTKSEVTLELKENIIVNYKYMLAHSEPFALKKRSKQI